MDFKPIKYVKLYGTTNDNTLTLSGNDTFELKDAIKAVGGKWQKMTKNWVITEPTDLSPLINAALSLSSMRDQEAKNKRIAAKAKRMFDATPEGQAAIKAAAKSQVLSALIAKQAGTSGYHWICCEHCIVIDWARQHTSCTPCGSFDGQTLNTFRVGGRLYTGT